MPMFAARAIPCVAWCRQILKPKQPEEKSKMAPNYFCSIMLPVLSAATAGQEV